VDELEALLARYRPGGPPPELRDRVLGRRSQDAGRLSQGRRLREWIYPIAAAAAAIWLYALTDSTHRRVVAATSPVDADLEQAIAEMTVDLGGDDSARLLAERLIRAMESPDAETPGILAIEEIP